MCFINHFGGNIFSQKFQNFRFSKSRKFSNFSRKIIFFGKHASRKFPKNIFSKKYFFRSRKFSNFWKIVGLFWNFRLFETRKFLKFFEIFYLPKIGLWKMTHKMFCALTFLKINIFSQIQKQKLRLPLYSPKHPKTWQTDQNSKSYSIFSLGGAWTQFIY